jgi:hypothetical protein
VMRRAKGARCKQSRAGRQQTGDRMDRRRFERFFERQRRQDSRYTARHHRLACARRADHQRIVSAGCRDLERPPTERLPVNVREITILTIDGWCGLGRLDDRSKLRRIVERVDRFQQRSHGIQFETLDDRRLARVGLGKQQALVTFAPRGCRNRKDAARCLNATIQRQLAEQKPVAASTPSAIGRSNDAPPFRMSAGARLTVTLCGGNANPEFLIALRTRSRLSRTLASGKPTIVNVGRPNETSTSTCTGQASIPNTAAVRMQASMGVRECKTGAARETPQKRVSRVDVLTDLRSERVAEVAEYATLKPEQETRRSRRNLSVLLTFCSPVIQLLIPISGS